MPSSTQSLGVRSSSKADRQSCWTARAFYPTSGGQPFDTGRLAGIEVLEIVDSEGEVVHIMAAPLEGKTPVSGEIDWPRRFDHMQQHTGQHMLSAAFDRLFANRTTSFHMGAESSTIDLAKEMSPSRSISAVSEANRVVWKNRPVSIRFASEEEAGRLLLRKEPARQGLLRLIEVNDFDLSACGGTHVSRTGAIGLIAVPGSERFRGGTRLTFVCGGRALRAFDVYRKAISGTVRLLSVLPDELPAAVERLHTDARDLRKNVARLQQSLAGHEAARLLEGAEVVGGVRLVAVVVEGWDAAGLKSIASGIAAYPNVAAALVSSVSPSSVAIARSATVPVDAGGILAELVTTFGGRGGGKPELAQGGGLTGSPSDILTAARAMLARALQAPE